MITKEPQETADDGWFIWLFCDSKQENNQGKHGRQRPEQTEKKQLGRNNDYSGRQKHTQKLSVIFSDYRYFIHDIRTEFYRKL